MPREQKSISDIVRNFHNLDRDLVTDILITHSSGVKLLTAPPDAQSGEQVTGEHIRQVLQHMSNDVRLHHRATRDHHSTRSR